MKAQTSPATTTIALTQEEVGEAIVEYARRKGMNIGAKFNWHTQASLSDQYGNPQKDAAFICWAHLQEQKNE